MKFRLAAAQGKGHASNDPGKQFLGTRDLIMLDTNIGLVVLPIGMARVSSGIVIEEVDMDLCKRGNIVPPDRIEPAESTTKSTPIVSKTKALSFN